MSRSSEAFYRDLTITAPEQVEAAEKVSQELLHPVVETMPDCGERVARDRTVLENPVARQVHRAEPGAGMQGVWCGDVLNALPGAIYYDGCCGTDHILQSGCSRLFRSHARNRQRSLVRYVAPVLAGWPADGA
jgi:hypothetical protein